MKRWFRSQFPVACIAVIAAALLSSAARAQGTIDFEKGTSPDGGTVTVKITLSDGRTFNYPVKVKPGDSTATVSSNIASAITGDFANPLNADPVSQTITDKDTGNKLPLDSVKLGVNKGSPFTIQSVKVDADDTGLHDRGSTSGTSQDHVYNLMKIDPFTPGLVKFSAVVADSGSITADLNYIFSNGTPADQILDTISAGLNADGFSSFVAGDNLTLMTGGDEELLIGGYSLNSGVPFGYEQVVTAEAVPEPQTFVLCGSMLLLLGALRKRTRRTTLSHADSQ